MGGGFAALPSNFHPTDFYPASGFRGYSGDLYHAGIAGYYWSNAPGSSASMYGASMNLTNDRAFPEDYYNRGYGFPVRCVQE